MNTPAEYGGNVALVFVYGSLKRGFALHRELSGQQFLGAATTEPEYRLLDCGDYPGMLRVSSVGQSVKGEVYRVDADCLRRLDHVEGVDEGHYSRDRVKLKSPFDSEMVWAYFYLGDIAGLRGCGREWP